MRRVREAVAEEEARRRRDSEERRRIRLAEEMDSAEQGEEADEEDVEEAKQIKAIEKMLDDPELRLDRVPRYFYKISNAYFMSVYRYYH